MKIQIAIVSEQILPNLIPCLIAKPEKVFLLSSTEMLRRGKTQQLAQEIRRVTQDVVVHENLPDANMREIQEFLLQFAVELRTTYPDAELTVNVTGGNKLMSMGLAEILRDDAAQIIYVDTAHRRIEILPDAQGHVAPSIAMQNELDVVSYLRAQGLSYAGADSDDAACVERMMQRKELCKLMAKEIGKLEWFISQLNGMAYNATKPDNPSAHTTDKLLRPVQSFKKMPYGVALTVLKKMHSKALLRWQGNSLEVEFVDMQALRFLSGGWLEEYAWHILRDEKLHDVRMSVNVSDKQIKNEFDVLACQQNQLLFVECKTLRFSGENDNEIAYKVDSLGRDARGLFGETWLLSAREPTNLLKERAQHARIKLIGPDELPKLKDIVRTWRKD